MEVDDRRADIVDAIEAVEAVEPTAVDTPLRESESRDTQGKFASRELTDKASPVKAPVSSDGRAESRTPRAPHTWRKEAQALWHTLSPEIQSEVIKREVNAAEGVRMYKPDAEIGQTLKKAMQPYEADFKQLNTTAMQAAIDIMPVVRTLYFGTPVQKAQLLAQLAIERGIDPSVLGAYAPQQVDPHISNLMGEVTGIRQYLEQQRRADYERQQESAEQENQALRGEVEQFTATHQHVDELRPTMVSLLHSGAAETLDDAYELALYSRPDLRAAISPQANPVQAARRRSVSVKGSPIGESAPTDPSDRRAAILHAMNKYR